jgi:ribosomal protein S24E
MDVKKDIKNNLLKRREVSFVAEADKTLSYPEATKMIADNFKCEEDCIMVEKVAGKFGRNTFLIEACIYDSKELKEEAVKRLVKPKKGSA